ncbi:hypothetical protein MJO28_016693 [Puccinia striiformis f. sp. tritici]|uniref:Uncharacterized protein n=1 Tax=Puccinia striiformis f. sp. tritici TaxID=168172 RepID=A0ACC0DNZ3_9BASI|nr:hypothetical protein MJO28_016693 [Puccinia striiformis f. sp. tritici]
MKEEAEAAAAAPFQHRHASTSTPPPPPPPPAVPARPAMMTSNPRIKMPRPELNLSNLGIASSLNSPNNYLSSLPLPQLPPSSPIQEKAVRRRTSLKSPILNSNATLSAEEEQPPPTPPPRPRHRSHTTTTNTTPLPPPPKPPPKPPKLIQPQHPIGPREWTPTNNLNSPTHRSAQSGDSHNITRYYLNNPSSTTPSHPPNSALYDRRPTAGLLSTPLGIGFPTSSLKPRSPLTYDSEDDDDDFDLPETNSSNLPYGSFPPPPPPPPKPLSSANRNRNLSRALSGSWLESPLKTAGQQQQEYTPSAIGGGRSFYDSVGRVEDMPDATFANRRPPTLNPPVSINVGSQFSSWALRGNWLCTGHHQFRLWHAGTGECLNQVNSIQDIKITCMEFKAAGSSSSSSTATESASASSSSSSSSSSAVAAAADSHNNRFVWCGTKDGQLFEFDCAERRIIDSRASLHSTSVIGVFRCKEGGMCSIDEGSKVQIWSNPSGVNSTIKISSTPRTQRIADKTNFVKMISHRLWTSSGPSGSKTASISAQRGPSIRVYDPDPSQAWTLTPRPISIPESVIGNVLVGMVTAGAVLPSRPDLVYLGHESGHVSVWETYFNRAPQAPKLPPPPPPHTSSTEFGLNQRSKTEPLTDPSLSSAPPLIKFRKLIKLSNYQITAMEGVTKYLWVGFRTGNVYVYEPEIQSPQRPPTNTNISPTNTTSNHSNGSGSGNGEDPYADCRTPNQAHFFPPRKTSFHTPHSISGQTNNTSASIGVSTASSSSIHNGSGSWKVCKVWRAHKDAVLKIIVDPSLLWDEVGKLHVATTSTDWKVKVWDGTMSVDWLANEMKKRQAEYCTYRPIKALICSWNVDACKPNDLSGTCDNLNFLEDVLKSSFSPPSSSSTTDSNLNPPTVNNNNESDQHKKIGLFSSRTLKFPLNNRKINPALGSGSGQSNHLSSLDAPDLIVFGFQEMIDLENKKLTAKTVLLGGRKKPSGNNTSSSAGNSEKLSDSVSQVYRKWHDKLVATVRTFMPPDDPYVVIHTENLVGLFTCVFVKSSERAKIRDIAVTTVKTGMKGRYGNKGAILARLVIDDSSICFINCHLAAGQKHVRQRNSDLIDILEEKSGFPDPPDRVIPNQQSGSSNKRELVEVSSGVYVGGGNGSSISDHEICFIQGDLNYRIDAQREDVIRAIAAGEYWKLLEFDQLIKEKKLNPNFRLRSFAEPPIRFHPTYKYDPGTHMYDSSEKARVPAWCDRILYRTPMCESSPTEEPSPPTIYIQQDLGLSNPSHTTPTLTNSRANPSSSSSKIVESLDYRRYEVNISDHRPISGAFKIHVKSVVPGLKRLVIDHAIDKWIDVEHSILKESRKYYSRF